MSAPTTASTWTRENWTATVTALLRRSATDQAFRQRCLTDPAGAVREISGFALPREARVRFMETNGDFVLQLPPFQSPVSRELTDQELETVVAGKAFFANDNRGTFLFFCVNG